jgi:AraC-like DNA-binding protein
LLKEYFSSDLINETGLPTVSHFAKSLNISDSYLSDLLRKETGTNTQENIHLYVINRSKDILINTNKSISEIAYELGFEYPQYFSRLFKKKTGETPREYRENDILSPSSAD